MPNRTFTSTQRVTRRAILGGAVSASTALAFATRGSCAVTTQGTPAATPEGHARSLVDPAWLRSQHPDPSLALVALMPADDFADAHIPGAVQIDWPALEVVDTSDASIASWREALQTVIASLGIAPTSTVVVYDNGSLFSSRLWWVLRYLGHDDVRVLNGGLPAWRQAGYSVESGEASKPETTAPLYRAVPQPDLLAQMDEVLASLDDPNVIKVDARTAEEYAEGHIPGAVNLNYPLNALPDPPRFWKPSEVLRTMYQEIGVTPDKRVIPYCSSGVRSAVTALTLHTIGYDDVALYTGSWQEWGSDPDAPVATGKAP